MKDLLGQVVIARDDFRAEQPDLAIAFARGMAKATLFGVTNPEAAVKIHWKAYPQSKPQAGDEPKLLKEAIHVFHGRFETQRDDTRADKRYGMSTLEQWEKVKGIDKAQGLIQGTFEAKDVFTNQFIDEINRWDQAAAVRQAKEYR